MLAPRSISWPGARVGVASVAGVQPLHVGAYIQALSHARSAPTAKQHLAAIRHLFDWLVMGQVVPLNSAASVRGRSHSLRRGQTPVLDPIGARQRLDAIDVTTPVGLRDRAMIGLMVFSFARIGAALGMKVENVYIQNRRLWVRLHEKGGKTYEMPRHNSLEIFLDAYLDGCDLRGDPKGPLFRTIERGRAVLTTTPLPQAYAYAMIGRRAAAAGIDTKIGNHTFRATGITASRTAARWRTRRRWPTTPPPAPRNFMIGAPTRSDWMRSNGCGFKANTRCSLSRGGPPRSRLLATSPAASRLVLPPAGRTPIHPPTMACERSPQRPHFLPARNAFDL
jgi:integrase